MIKKELTLVMRHGCSFCELAKSLLDDNDLTYTLLMLDEHFSRDEFYTMIPGAKTFPQILVNGKSIGGYDELSVEINNLKK